MFGNSGCSSTDPELCLQLSTFFPSKIGLCKTSNGPYYRRNGAQKSSHFDSALPDLILQELSICVKCDLVLLVESFQHRCTQPERNLASDSGE